MAEAFDPYRAWLGVMTDSTPPTHYELLGISPSRADADVVAEAYRRQMSRLNPHLSGENSVTAQKLASELANARVVLLTPTTKRAYDAELTARRRPEPNGSAAPKGGADDFKAAASTADSLLPPSAGPISPAAAEPKATLVTPNASSGIPHPPANQPQPPAGYPAASPAPGYAQQPPYGQGYPGGYPAAPYPQAAPAYPYGQPYPGAAQSYPNAAPSSYGAVPAYSPQPVAPGYPAPQPAAQSPAEPEIPISTRSSSAVSRTYRQKRSSPAPMLAGVAVAGLVIVGGVIYFVKTQQQPPVVVAPPSSGTAANSTESAGSQAADAQSPGDRVSPSNGKIQGGAPPVPNRFSPPVQNSGAAASNREKNTQEKLFTDDPPANGSNGDANDMPQPKPADGDSMPAGAGKTPASPESANPAMDKAEPEKPAVPVTPAESPEDKAAIEGALKAARQALADRDLAEAEIQLAQATLLAVSPETLQSIDRVKLMSEYVKQFWDAVRDILPTLQAAETFEVEGEQVSLVEASSQKIVLRVAGKNRSYQFPKFPAKLAEALAQRWLDQSNPASLLALGAFEAVDPKGDRRAARRLFEQAQARGVNAASLIEELDALPKAAQE